MRQRVVIAIAVACRPKILICDEPTTALDVTIQAQILDLIKQLQKKLELTTIYITHDLGVVANVADRIASCTPGTSWRWAPARRSFTIPSTLIPGRCCPPCPSSA
jgi:ABC-type dipeptide/oligopeptide/nickel transport system ATPase component